MYWVIGRSFGGGGGHWEKGRTWRGARSVRLGGKALVPGFRCRGPGLNSAMGSAVHVFDIVPFGK